ncbi:hypothetical protein [Halomarina rubra]|uniref:Uncharacterized protein n=1 Tax=Halomarina rubra TaxID=2071873 RepID=A0ABD6B100_9EURY|nr:hypothetical protein [Halomarina rubra]
MPSKTLKTFLAEHPKLFELAFAGTMVVGTIGSEMNTIAGNPGP